MTSVLFDPLSGTGDIAAALDDRAWLTALCEVETALARSCTQAGLVALPTALEIGAAAQALADSDPVELATQHPTGSEPVTALVETLRTRVRARAGDDAARAVHLGACEQDVLDSAAMLVSARALDLILPRLKVAASHCAALARAHRDTPMISRTSAQRCVATTFGALAAEWGRGLDRALARLATVRGSLPVQLGGAGGTLAALHPRGTDVRAALADELDLRNPGATWHIDRSIIAELANALGLVGAAVATVADHVVRLAQPEIGEVRETGTTASHGSVAAREARAAAAAVPALVATLVATVAASAEPWRSEYPALVALMRSGGAAASRLRDCLAGLEIDPVRMLANLGDVALELGHAGDLVDDYLGARR